MILHDPLNRFHEVITHTRLQLKAIRQLREERVQVVVNERGGPRFIRTVLNVHLKLLLLR